MVSPSPLERTLANLEPFAGIHVGSLDEFRAVLEDGRLEHDSRRSHEARLAASAEHFFLDGTCALCARPTRYWVDRVYGLPAAEGAPWPAPNWRERMICERCQINNRMRAALHYLLAFGQPLPTEPLYVTEQSTPLFAELQRLLPGAVGSEYLGPAVEPGSVSAAGLRHETLSGLSFETARFRFLLSFDVLEHVPETAPALAECARVLQPGGWLIFTVPFDLQSETTLRRASLAADGAVIHHAPPEYHGDPLNKDGILSYFTFGWDLLPQLSGLGFERVRAFIYWSERHGYLGDPQVLFSARRALT